MTATPRRPVNIGLLGAGGRMGAAILRRLAAAPGLRLAAAAERPGHPAVGAPAGDAGVAIGADQS